MLIKRCMVTKGIIFDIQRGSLVDGDGVRTTVFFKGCSLNCKWCHNPEGIESSIQLVCNKSKCTDCEKCVSICPNQQKHCTLCGKCVCFCPNDAREIYGREFDADEVLDEILRDKTYYESSNGGVTFSGGECMLQIDFLEKLIKECKKNNINVSVDTAGNVPWEHFEKILPYTDTFLYDIKCVSEDLHRQGTGASNKLILQNLRMLSDKGAKIVIRIPVIGAFNDNLQEFEKISEYLRQVNIERIELLPYHNMGEHKYEALNLEHHSFTVPTKEQMDKLRNKLKYK